MGTPANGYRAPGFHLRRIGPRGPQPDAANYIHFLKPVTLIGRNKSVVDYFATAQDPHGRVYISRIHARVICASSPMSFRLMDSSFTGVYVNDVRIDAEHFLNEGDTVTFGHPSSGNICPGTRARQPNSELYFLFERCQCRMEQSSEESSPEECAVSPPLKLIEDNKHAQMDTGIVTAGPSAGGETLSDPDRNTSPAPTPVDIMGVPRYLSNPPEYTTIKSFKNRSLLELSSRETSNISLHSSLLFDSDEEGSHQSEEGKSFTIKCSAQSPVFSVDEPYCETDAKAPSGDVVESEYRDVTSPCHVAQYGEEELHEKLDDERIQDQSVVECDTLASPRVWPESENQSLGVEYATNEHIADTRDSPMTNEHIADTRDSPMTNEHIADTHDSPMTNENIADTRDSPMTNEHTADTRDSPMTNEHIADTCDSPMTNENIADTRDSPMTNEHIADTRDSPMTNEHIADTCDSPMTNEHIADTRDSPMTNEHIADTCDSPVAQLLHQLDTNREYQATESISTAECLAYSNKSVHIYKDSLPLPACNISSIIQEDVTLDKLHKKDAEILNCGSLSPAVVASVTVMPSAPCTVITEPGEKAAAEHFAFMSIDDSVLKEAEDMEVCAAAGSYIGKKQMHMDPSCEQPGMNMESNGGEKKLAVSLSQAECRGNGAPNEPPGICPSRNVGEAFPSRDSSVVMRETSLRCSGSLADYCDDQISSVKQNTHDSGSPSPLPLVQCADDRPLPATGNVLLHKDYNEKAEREVEVENADYYCDSTHEFYRGNKEPETGILLPKQHLQQERHKNPSDSVSVTHLDPDITEETQSVSVTHLDPDITEETQSVSVTHLDPDITEETQSVSVTHLDPDITEETQSVSVTHLDPDITEETQSVSVTHLDPDITEETQSVSVTHSAPDITEETQSVSVTHLDPDITEETQSVSVTHLDPDITEETQSVSVTHLDPDITEETQSVSVTHLDPDITEETQSVSVTHLDPDITEETQSVSVTHLDPDITEETQSVSVTHLDPDITEETQSVSVTHSAPDITEETQSVSVTHSAPDITEETQSVSVTHSAPDITEETQSVSVTHSAPDITEETQSVSVTHSAPDITEETQSVSVTHLDPDITEETQSFSVTHSAPDITEETQSVSVTHSAPDITEETQSVSVTHSAPDITEETQSVSVTHLDPDITEETQSVGVTHSAPDITEETQSVSVTHLDPDITEETQSVSVTHSAPETGILLPKQHLQQERHKNPFDSHEEECSFDFQIVNVCSLSPSMKLQKTNISTKSAANENVLVGSAEDQCIGGREVLNEARHCGQMMDTVKQTSVLSQDSNTNGIQIIEEGTCHYNIADPIATVSMGGYPLETADFAPPAPVAPGGLGNDMEQDYRSSVGLKRCFDDTGTRFSSEKKVPTKKSRVCHEESQKPPGICAQRDSIGDILHQFITANQTPRQSARRDVSACTHNPYTIAHIIRDYFRHLGTVSLAQAQSFSLTHSQISVQSQSVSVTHLDRDFTEETQSVSVTHLDRDFTEETQSVSVTHLDRAFTEETQSVSVTHSAPDITEETQSVSVTHSAPDITEETQSVSVTHTALDIAEETQSVSVTHLDPDITEETQSVSVTHSAPDITEETQSVSVTHLDPDITEETQSVSVTHSAPDITEETQSVSVTHLDPDITEETQSVSVTHLDPDITEETQSVSVTHTALDITEETQSVSVTHSAPDITEEIQSVIVTHLDPDITEETQSVGVTHIPEEIASVSVTHLDPDITEETQSVSVTHLDPDITEEIQSVSVTHSAPDITEEIQSVSVTHSAPDITEETQSVSVTHSAPDITEEIQSVSVTHTALDIAEETQSVGVTRIPEEIASVSVTHTLAQAAGGDGILARVRHCQVPEEQRQKSWTSCKEQTPSQSCASVRPAATLTPPIISGANTSLLTGLHTQGISSCNCSTGTPGAECEWPSISHASSSDEPILGFVPEPHASRAGSLGTKKPSLSDNKMYNEGTLPLGSSPENIIATGEWRCVTHARDPMQGGNETSSTTDCAQLEHGGTAHSHQGNLVLPTSKEVLEPAHCSGVILNKWTYNSEVSQCKSRNMNPTRNVIMRGECSSPTVCASQPAIKEEEDGDECIRAGSTEVSSPTAQSLQGPMQGAAGHKGSSSESPDVWRNLQTISPFREETRRIDTEVIVIYDSDEEKPFVNSGPRAESNMYDKDSSRLSLKRKRKTHSLETSKYDRGEFGKSSAPYTDSSAVIVIDSDDDDEVDVKEEEDVDADYGGVQVSGEQHRPKDSEEPSWPQSGSWESPDFSAELANSPYSRVGSPVFPSLYNAQPASSSFANNMAPPVQPNLMHSHLGEHLPLPPLLPIHSDIVPPDSHLERIYSDEENVSKDSDLSQAMSSPLQFQNLPEPQKKPIASNSGESRSGTPNAHIKASEGPQCAWARSEHDVKFQLSECQSVLREVSQVLCDIQGIDEETMAQWRKGILALQEESPLPQTHIAVVGDTGAGKSSLLNALLEQDDVLPTSAMRACTAVVVEIEKSSVMGYKAEVEFLSKEEWERELKALITDMKDKSGRFKRRPDNKPEAKVAHSRVMAVYGKIAELDELNEDTAVTKHLGERLQICNSTASAFRSAIEKYIDTNSELPRQQRKGGQFWPIVRCVRIFVPEAEVLRTGAVLVDLPGTRDSNAARDRIAKEYLQKCDVVWAVANITRAVDDKTAKEILTSSLRRQLFMDGHFENMAVICTKTDLYNTQEIKRALNLHDETNRLEDTVVRLGHRLTRLEAEKQTLYEQWERGGDFAAGNDPRNEILAKEKEINRLKQEKDESLRNINLMCVRARNNYSKQRIRQDFCQSRQELEKGEDEADGEEEDEEERDAESSMDEGVSEGPGLRVFTVSSKEFLELRRRSPLEGSTRLFSSERDTEIPDLRDYAIETALRCSMLAAERVTRNTACIISQVITYLLNRKAQDESHQEQMKLTVEGCLEGLRGQLREAVSLCNGQMTTYIQEKIKGSLFMGVICAEKSCENTVRKWGSRQSGGYSYPTYRATCARHGYYSSPACGVIDFNEQLSQPITNAITRSWTEVFSGELVECLSRFNQSVSKLLALFFRNMRSQLVGLGSGQEMISFIEKQQLKSTQAELLNFFVDQKEYISRRQRHISRLLTPEVQKRMIEVYNDCQSVKGEGSFERMKSLMFSHVKERKQQIFGDAALSLMEQLHFLQTYIRDSLSNFVKERLYSLRQQCEPLLQPMKKEEEMLPDLRNIWSRVSHICQRSQVDFRLPELEITPKPEPCHQETRAQNRVEPPEITCLCKVVRIGENPILNCNTIKISAKGVRLVRAAEPPIWVPFSSVRNCEFCSVLYFLTLHLSPDFAWMFHKPSFQTADTDNKLLILLEMPSDAQPLTEMMDFISWRQQDTAWYREVDLHEGRRTLEKMRVYYTEKQEPKQDVEPDHLFLNPAPSLSTAPPSFLGVSQLSFSRKRGSLSPQRGEVLEKKPHVVPNPTQQEARTFPSQAGLHSAFPRSPRNLES
ncbi:nuclear GTPase SLIP-GC isoform X2 [Xenopus tropicalis]|uniref:Nuclear GTPase SLIP-GC isoform X2 n=1 Tax=Xenopus tropicalis TaxID=8364 RepID=A0A8J1JSU4_XENTR|nr:nuclear GTPase SLIP-GC isoform X2 [Xenopus tropicalis]